VGRRSDFQLLQGHGSLPLLNLGHPDNPKAVKFCDQLGGISMRRMDSGADPKERLRIIQAFAPKANDKPEWIGTEKEIDILVSTDVLSEGQNLQDAVTW